MFPWSLITTVAGWLLRMSSVKFLRDLGTSLQGATDNAAAVSMKQIEAEMEARKAARDIRLATSGFWEMRLITFAIAGCFTLHLIAVTLDTVFMLGWGIPKYPRPFDEYEGVILLSFFGVHGMSMILGGLVSIFHRR